MDDLIERDAALARIDCCLGNSLGGRKEFDSGLMQARKFVLSTPAVNRWIPCSERLPDYFVWCLVCMSDGCIRLGKWNGEYDEQGVWWVSHPNSGGKLYRIKNVPFWMPLPELPKRDGE